MGGRIPEKTTRMGRVKGFLGNSCWMVFFLDPLSYHTAYVFVSLPRRINEEFASLLSLRFFAVLQNKNTSSSTAGGVQNTSQLHKIIFPTEELIKKHIFELKPPPLSPVCNTLKSTFVTCMRLLSGVKDFGWRQTWCKAYPEGNSHIPLKGSWVPMMFLFNRWDMWSFSGSYGRPEVSFSKV